MQIATPQWGHAVLSPEGTEIRLPSWGFVRLRRLGVLFRNRELKRHQISKLIYSLLDPTFDCLTDGLRNLIGGDCSGPQWVSCRCDDCKPKSGHAATSFKGYSKQGGREGGG